MKNFETILEFWFSAPVRPLWYIKTPALDAQILEQFGKLYQGAIEGTHDHWQDSAESTLALVILLDQFSRNLFRDSPKAFAMDVKAMQIAKDAVAQGFDQQLLSDEQRLFLYMPYMHSEVLADQEKGMLLFARLSDNGQSLHYAQLHRNIIAQFGRFPHRNNVLGRTSTPEELEFLKGPNSSF